MTLTADTLLVSSEDVLAYARESARTLEDADPYLLAAQQALESYVGYRLFVHAAEQSLGQHFSLLRGRYVWADAWPVVQVTAANVTVSPDRQRLEFRSLPTPTDRECSSGTPVFAYFAGYRRAGQTLAELQAIAGLEELATLPPELPWDLHAAICEAAILISTRAVSGLIGQRQIEQDLGHSVTRITALERGALRRIFDEWASGYRKLV